MRRFLFILIMMLFPLQIWGQHYNPEIAPSWINGYYKDLPKTYISVVSAEAYSRDDARGKALQKIASERSLATGQRVIIDGSNENTIVNDELTVKCRILDKYYEYSGPGQHKIYLLVQTAKNPSYDYEAVEISDEYRFSLRTLIPGMAQIHKGSTTKGYIMIGGEIACIGGAVLCHSMISSNISKANMTQDANAKQTYMNNINALKDVRNMMIAGAVAVYAWSIIDGIVAKGIPQIHIDGYALNFSPYANPLSTGFTLSMNF